MTMVFNTSRSTCDHADLIECFAHVYRTDSRTLGVVKNVSTLAYLKIIRMLVVVSNVLNNLHIMFKYKDKITIAIGLLAKIR